MTLVACRYFCLGPLGPVYQYQYVYCSRTQIVIRVLGEAHAEIYPEAWDGGPAKGRGGGARMNCSKVSFNVVLKWDGC